MVRVKDPALRTRTIASNDPSDAATHDVSSAAPAGATTGLSQPLGYSITWTLNTVPGYTQT
jgi:hypothetical protein